MEWGKKKFICKSLNNGKGRRERERRRKKNFVYVKQHREKLVVEPSTSEKLTWGNLVFWKNLSFESHI